MRLDWRFVLLDLREAESVSSIIAGLAIRGASCRHPQVILVGSSLRKTKAGLASFQLLLHPSRRLNSFLLNYLMYLGRRRVQHIQLRQMLRYLSRLVFWRQQECLLSLQMLNPPIFKLSLALINYLLLPVMLSLHWPPSWLHVNLIFSLIFNTNVLWALSTHKTRAEVLRWVHNFHFGCSLLRPWW